MDVMSVEYFPTNVRSLGMGLLAAAGRYVVLVMYCNVTNECDVDVDVDVDVLQVRINQCPVHQRHLRAVHPSAAVCDCSMYGLRRHGFVSIAS